MAQTHTIKIVMDDRTARAQIAAVNNQIQQIGSSQIRNPFAPLTQGASGAGTQLSTLQARVAATGQNATRAAGQVNALSTGIKTLSVTAVAAGAALATLGVTLIAAKAMSATKEYQSLNAALVVATGSTDKASAAFKRLQTFAAATPFSLNQSVEGFIKLKNLGLDPSERAMTSFGNTSASMGKDMMQMVEAVADATTGEFERLKEFGIKSQVEGNKVKFTFAGVTTAVGKNANDIQNYLIQLGETKFAGAMDLQSKTLGGALNSLGDSVDQLLVKFGEGFAPAMMEAINAMSEGTTNMTEFATVMGEMVGTTLGTVIEAVSFLAENIKVLGAAALFLAGTAMSSYVASMVAAGAASVRLIGFQTGMIASMTGVSRAAALASVSLNTLAGAGRGAMALFGGPWGVALGAAAVAVGYLTTKSIEARGELNEMAAATADVSKRLEEARKRYDEATVSTDSATGASKTATGQFIVMTPIVGVLAGEYGKLGDNAQYAALQMARADQVKAKSDIAKLDEKRARTGRIRTFAQVAPLGIGAAVGAGAAAFGLTYNNEDEKARKDAQRRLKEAEELESLVLRTPGSAYIDKPASSSPAASLDPKKTKKGPKDNSVEEAKRRLEIQNEYWEGLRNELTMASMLQREADKFNTALEVKKAYGEDWKKLNDDERTALIANANAMKTQTLQAQGIRDLKQATLTAEQEHYLKAQKRLGLIGQEADIQDALDTARASEMAKYSTLAEGVAAINTEDWKIHEKKLAAILGQNAAIDEQDRKLKALTEAGNDLVMSASDRFDPKRAAKANYERQKAELAAAKFDPSKGISEEEWKRRWEEANEQITREFEKDMKDIATEFHRSMMDSIDDLGDALGDIFGDKVGKGLGGLMKAITNVAGALGKKDGFDNDTLMRSGNGPIARGMTAMSDMNTKLGTMFGKNGDLVKGLNKTLGSLGAGAAIGEQITPFAKMLWGKFSSTGAQIGGAIGNFAGPVGAVVGSLIGGTIGGLMKKTKKASGSLGFDPFGNLNFGNVSGTSAKYKAEAQAAGDAVVSGLYSIAQKLGGEIGGTPSTSIGIRHGDYRVDTSGKGITKKKNGAIDFDGDKEGAIQFAIADAIKDGVIIGISDFSTRILKSGKNLDSAVALAESYENILKELASLDNPAKAAFENITKSVDRVLTQMRMVGATAAEMANVERYRTVKLKEVLEDQLSSLSDFQKTLNGEGSGLTALTRFQTAMNEFNSFRSDIAAGKTIDQDKFTEAGQKIFGLASELYGTNTQQFQDLRAMLMDATAGAVENVKVAYDDAQVVAIKQAEQARAQQHDQTNLTLKEILDAIRNGTMTQVNAAAGGIVGGGSAGGRIATGRVNSV